MSRPVSAKSKPPVVKPVAKVKTRAKFPWLALLILIGSVVVFWVLPMQQGSRPIRVDFSETQK